MIRVCNLNKLTWRSSWRNTNPSNAPHFKHNFTTPSTKTYSKSNPTNPNFTKLNQINKHLISYNTQITKHGRNNNIKESESIFNNMSFKNVISWTAMLTAYAENGEIDKARKLFDEMPQRNIASWNAMISSYIRSNGRILEAYELFWQMPKRNNVSYGAMITGLVRAGMLHEAERVYGEMPRNERDPVGSNALMCGYLKFGDVDKAVRVFEGMVERDVVSWSSMVDGYCKNGRVSEACELFRVMPERNVVSWTAMINGYMKDEKWEDGFELFREMRREGNVEVNSTTLSVILEGCSTFCKLREGIQIHGVVLSMGFGCNSFLGSSLITMYSRVGLMDDANRIFRAMNNNDVVSWNSLITGYVQNGLVEDAYDLFRMMPQRDVVSWTSVIVGLSAEGRMGECVSLFCDMPKKDDVAWTAVISGFASNGEYKKAFYWFIHMLREAIRPDTFTFCSVLGASAGLAKMDRGEQIHALIVKMDMEHDVSVQNSLVFMYAKCGNLAGAHQIFTSIRTPNLVSINSMITGFAQHGLVQEALKLFEKIQNEGHEPNEITFLCVLSACSHGGRVKEGWDCFKSMSCLYGVEPGPDHYACMVDLLGRAGFLKHALDLICSMPCRPHKGVWGALLSASRTYMDIDLAKLAATHLIKLEPDNAATYTVLSGIYSNAGLKKDGEVLRTAMKANGVKKNPGYSWL